MSPVGVATVLAVLAAECSCALLSPPLRIMPLGDSITEWSCAMGGEGLVDRRDKATCRPAADDSSTDVVVVPSAIAAAAANGDDGFWVSAPGGYRGYLGDLLGRAGVAFEFVGSRWGCGKHEGHSGQTLEYLSNIVNASVALYRPDVVLLQAGTNDFFFPQPRGCHAKEAVIRLHAVLDRTFSAVPGSNVTVLLSTVTLINATRCKDYPQAPWHPIACPPSMQGDIAAFNALLPEVVDDYRRQGRRIYLHDVNAAANFVAEDYWIWGIHFNNTGFEKMANAWYSALETARLLG
eukprot:m.264565 g.264565  ORF g.264565 m.264565 type:complete len:293 (-) comp19250_c2_seq3:152-1030(-)